MKADALVTDNHASGIVAGTNGIFTMASGTISGNSGENSGGGVLITGLNSEFTMSGGKISGNTVFITEQDNGGGGVTVKADGNFALNGGVITGNTASLRGGGLYVNNAIFDMEGGEITDNNALVVMFYSLGSGVYLSGSNSVDANGKIRGDPSVGTKVEAKALYTETRRVMCIIRKWSKSPVKAFPTDVGEAFFGGVAASVL
jgi:hypothetical protein